MRNCHAPLRCFLLFALACVIPAAISWAGVIDVPADYPTIQAGIDAAADSDTVLVAAGTYTGPDNRNLNLQHKDIVVMSAGGAGVTIIDCQGLGRGFMLHGTLTEAAVVDGFTITHGTRGVGAGISVAGSSAPTIKNCRIVDNQATFGGGGVYATGTCSPTFTNCTIENNRAPVGGGVQVGEDAWALSVDSTIVGTGGSQAIGSVDGNSRFENCVIRGNQADQGGGGLSINGVHFGTLVGCTITGNLAERGGGLGIIAADGLRINSCTVAANHALSNGGGMYVDGVIEPPVDRTIVWSNCAEGQGDQIYTTSSGGLSFACGDVDDAGVEGAGSVQYDANTIHVDPLFCKEFFCTSAPTTDGEYTLDDDSQALASHSPCSLLIGSQPQGCTSRSFEVGGGGRFDKIQDAIDRTVSGVGDVVVVGEDTWTGPRNTELDFGGRNIKLKSEGGAQSAVIDGGDLVRGIAFRSGETSDAVVEGLTFTRCASETPGSAVLVEGESSPVIRDCVIKQNHGNGSVVCVESGQPAFQFCTIEENTSTSPDGVLDLIGGSPSVESCIIRNNTAPNAVNVGTPAIISTTQITDNVGAGLYLQPTASNASVDIFPGPVLPDASLAFTSVTDTDISRNADRGVIIEAASSYFEGVILQENGGGGVVVTGLGSGALASRSGGSVASETNTTNVFTDCEFSGHSTDRGAGFFFDCTNEPETPYTVTFTNCQFTGNHATFEGGGIAICGRATNADITPIFNNCTIAANSAHDGGGIYMGVTEVGIGRTAHADFGRTILWGNCSTVSTLGEAFVAAGNEINIGCSHTAVDEIAGTGVVTTSQTTTGIPAFCNYPGLYYSPNCQTSATTAGDFDLSPGSPAAPANHPCGPSQIGAFPVVNCVPTAIVDRPVPEVSTAIKPAMPNPFNPVTSLEYTLRTDARVLIRVYDVNGGLTRTLLDRPMPAGSHRIEWDGKDDHGKGAASGVYFLRFEAGSTKQTQKLVLLK